MFKVALVILFLVGSFSRAEEVAGRDFPAEILIGTQKLVLNGGGVREVDRFGLSFKVVAMALYATSKSNSADTLMSLKGPIVIKGSYLRAVNGADIAESVESAFRSNCITDQVNCETSFKVFKSFSSKFPDMRDKDTLEYRIFENKVEYNVSGRKPHQGTLEGAEVAKNFLSMYIGPKADKKLKERYLGGK